ncbi:hypothetical protein B9S64_20170 [Streptomyces sp. SM18]|nr:hypothetical protein B9S64_20170 [Streptomyces sp. SM18]
MTRPNGRTRRAWRRFSRRCPPPRRCPSPCPPPRPPPPTAPGAARPSTPRRGSRTCRAGGRPR